MQVRNLKEKAKKVVAFAGVVAVAAVNSAHAAGVDISAEVAQAKTDIQTNGALILGVVVTIAAVAWLRRVIH